MGFDQLPKETAKEIMLPEKIRLDLIRAIKEKIGAVRDKGEILGVKESQSDDWLIVTSSLDLAFKFISEILDLNTGYVNFKIPLEIVVGVGEYGEQANLEGENLSVQQATINFFKSEIKDHFSQWYKINNDGNSPKTSYIIISDSAYLEMEVEDKKFCRKIFLDDPRKQIIHVVDVEGVKRRARVGEFLKVIGRPESKLYNRIDTLYVPPNEYEEIKTCLETNRIVFITGTAEYGKTYTAVRFLWEFYNRGYSPVWRQGQEELQRIKVREALEEIDKELKSHHIIYFEDPFGKIKYERSESLERMIGGIIDSVKAVEDVYVVLTSREEVFKEFEKENLSLKELKNFESDLNIKKPSYDYKKRQQILLLWAESKKCEWLTDSLLKKFVLDSLRDERNLPSPLSIRSFVLSTVNISSAFQLEKTISERSVETSRSFANELEHMTSDKILFFLFPFIDPIRPFSQSGLLTIDLVREVYSAIVKEIGEQEALCFDDALKWFQGDKIDVSDGTICFSHPSYYEAMDYILTDKRSANRKKREILGRVLLKLAQENVDVVVTNFLDSGFDKICDLDSLILSLISIPSISDYMIDLFENTKEFAKINETCRTQLLFKLAESPSTIRYAAVILGDNFDKISETSRTRLMVELAKNSKIAYPVAYALVKNYQLLSEELKTLLQKLSATTKMDDPVACALAIFYDKIPEELKALLKNLVQTLSEPDPYEWHWVRNFGNLPDDIKIEILLKFAENPDAVTRAKFLFRKDFHNLPMLPESVKTLLKRKRYC